MSEPSVTLPSPLDAPDGAQAIGPLWVTMPSGRGLDLRRSRWDGVLDAEEHQYCRTNEIPLAYDCVQIGWVTQTCTDDSMAHPPRMQRHASDRSPAMDPEHRAVQLRSQVVEAARQVLADVDAGRLPVERARQRLTVIAAGTTKAVASELTLAELDLCHWAVQCAAIEASVPVLGPPHPPPSVGSRPIGFRPWTVDDVDVFTDLLGNPNVWEHLPEPFPATFTADTARALIEVGAIDFHHETVAIEVSGTPVGQCFVRFDRAFAGSRAAEVGYWLGEQHWGKGLMRSTLPTFTHRCFQRHQVDVLYAWIRTDNVASIRVAEHAGYERAPFPREPQLAASMGRPGFVRYATFRVEWELADA